ncbi:RNA-dependent RNA polymerase [Syncephalastrum racemosum totivirus 1]|nr:RNA-dependent RNA polymerase [Syncephalastrum racemosum totivirus 1]
MFDFSSTTVRSKIIRYQNRNYLYYKVNQTLMPRTRQILGALSRHYIGDFTGYYNDWTDFMNVFVDLPKATNKWRIQLSQLKDLPKAKISGTHHIHYTAQEVWDVLTEEQRSKAAHALRLPAESTTSFVGGTMLWLATLDDMMFHPIVESALLDQEDDVAFAKLGKKISVRAKSFQNIVEQDLRALFEIDVLVNRNTGAVDWEGEKHNRSKPDLANVSPKRIYDAAVKMFSRDDQTAQEPRNLTWDKFWQARWQWSASGSIHSQYKEDLKDLPSEHELKTKFIALNLQPKRDIEYFLQRQPELVSWSSIKYEWGKMRAIYGTDLTSYVLAHFAFFNCEDTLPNEFPVGSKARPSYVAAKVGSVLKDKVPLCVDFEDFNSQHSIKNMQMVIDAYIHTKRKYLTEDQVRAAEWTRDSIERTIVHDNMGTRSTYQAHGTLMSGWRLTTFINSVLNYIYTHILADEKDVHKTSVHNGDDVLLGVNNFALVVRTAYNAKKFKIRLQRSKCAFGGLAEFLRVDRLRGDHGQYLTRNIATIMHSRIESKMALGVTDVVSSNEERLREYLQRGGDYGVATRLRYTYLSRTGKIYDTPAHTMYAVKMTHRVAGGISDNPKGEIEYEINKQRTQVETALPPKMPGVQAYAEALKDSLKLKVPYGTVVERIYSATLNAVQLVRTSVKRDRVEDKYRMAVYRALYKAHHDIATTPLFGKAMLTGFVFDVLSKGRESETLSRILSSSRDPMRLLKVVT